ELSSEPQRLSWPYQSATTPSSALVQHGCEPHQASRRHCRVSDFCSRFAPTVRLPAATCTLRCHVPKSFLRKAIVYSPGATAREYGVFPTNPPSRNMSAPVGVDQKFNIAAAPGSLLATAGGVGADGKSRASVFCSR